MMSHGGISTFSHFAYASWVYPDQNKKCDILDIFMIFMAYDL